MTKEKTEWECDLGNGEFDHDWEECSDSAGECDGGPGDYWEWRQCRVCGIIEEDFLSQSPISERTEI